MPTYRYQWLCLQRVLTLAAQRGYTVQITPVPERDDNLGAPRGYVVLGLCPMATAPDTPHTCWLSGAHTPLACILEAYDYLVGGWA